MKAKNAETSAKTNTTLTPKDVLPMSLLGKQREAVSVKRPAVDGTEEKSDARQGAAFVDRNFAEWSKEFETLDSKEKDAGKVFREEGYEYLQLGPDRPCVWKRASEFFWIVQRMQAEEEAAVFQSFCDDSAQYLKKTKLSTLRDDSAITYHKSFEKEPVKPTMCDFDEAEETDAAFAARQAEFDQSYRPKPGHKKPVLVTSTAENDH